MEEKKTLSIGIFALPVCGSFIFFVMLFSTGSCGGKAVGTVHSKQVAANVSSSPFALPPLPKKMIFCGQLVHLKDEDIREKLDREILVNAFFQSATSLSLKRASRYFPTIEKVLKEEGIPTDMKYLAVIESGLTQAISPAGAQGFWQFMPRTAIEFDLEISEEVDERLHIERSTRATCRYLKNANAHFNDWLWTAASFNRGIGGVKKDMNWQGTSHYFDTDMNSETGRYVFRILAVKIIFENPILFGYDPQKMELYEPFSTQVVTVSKTIPNLADWSLKRGINFKILTLLNPWIKGNRLSVRKKSYQLLLPSPSENLKPYHKYS
jgi:membrane-bound lytic murein transglycosylase D